MNAPAWAELPGKIAACREAAQRGRKNEAAQVNRAQTVQTTNPRCARRFQPLQAGRCPLLIAVGRILCPPFVLLCLPAIPGALTFAKGLR